jgi:hypothetical protein
MQMISFSAALGFSFAVNPHLPIFSFVIQSSELIDLERCRYHLAWPGEGQSQLYRAAYAYGSRAVGRRTLMADVAVFVHR